MVFSSLEFLYLYLPVSLFVYFIIPAQYLKFRNLALLVFSLIFYGWSEPVYVFIMIFSIIVDYVCGYFVDKFLPVSKKKAARVRHIKRGHQFKRSRFLQICRFCHC